jgi:DNA polymerase III alpha subunit
MTNRYIELHANSAFSFLEAGSSPEALAERAFSLEMPALALMDRNGFYGSARFHKIASENKIVAHVGAEVSVTGFGNRLAPPIWLAEVEGAGIREIVVFHSTDQQLQPYQGNFPFQVIGDPTKSLYKKFGVGSLKLTVLDRT